MTDCKHENLFGQFNLGRISDTEGGPIIAWDAEIRIKCTDCDLPFIFVGLPLGMSPQHPTVSPDGEEARLPMYPAGTIPRPMDELAAQLREPKDVN